MPLSRNVLALRLFFEGLSLLNKLIDILTILLFLLV